MELSINGLGQTTETLAMSSMKVDTGENKQVISEDKSDDSQYTAISENGDTLEVSAAGQAASASMTSDEEESDSSSSSEDLSSYSVTELKQMYEKGEITMAEYETEMAKREAAGTADSDTDVAATVATSANVTQADTE